ncbi:CU044_5270 family protein [Kibdelosporangium lantanae]
MNDLDMVRKLLTTDEPTDEVVDRSRHQLRNRMLGVQRARRPMRARLVVAGTGVVAAAVAAVVVITSTSTPPPPPAGRLVTGQQVLLAAATSAERAQDGSGRYWHVKVTESTPGPNSTWEYWIDPNGGEWFRGAKSDGKVTHLAVRAQQEPFALAGFGVTLDQIRALPADPVALRARLADMVAHSGARTSAGPLTPDQQREATVESLVCLVSTAPAPPQVRAAALRAISTEPGVRNLGDAPGGVALEIPDLGRLVVDPSTGRVNGTSTIVLDGGGVLGMAEGETARVDAEWTDTLPK